MFMGNELRSDRIESAADDVIGENAGVRTAAEVTSESEARPESRSPDSQAARAKGLGQLLSLPVFAELIGGFGASVGTTLLVTKVADSVLSSQTRSFDHKVLDRARTTRHTHKKLTDPAMTALSAAGEPHTLYPLAALTAAWLVTQEQADDAALVMLAVGGSAGLQKVLKRIVHRPRPYWKLPFPRSRVSGSSFPSSHATMTLATYGTMAYFLSRKRADVPESTEAKEEPKQVTTRRRIAARIWAPVLLLCGLIGWSRVYQGVHNPSDVLGGWLAGGIWMLACTTVITRSEGK
jgi:undecaprenyl-diphosphatase